MDRYVLFLASILLLVTFVGCNSDFEVNDKWTDVPAVFCVLDQSQEYQYVKVNKCFLGNLPASQMAAVSDSLFYACDVKVRLFKKDGKNILRTWEFNRIDSIPKQAGFFANDRNTIWIGKPQLEAGAKYEIEINIDNGRIIARGDTEVVDGVSLSTPDERAPKIEMAHYANDFLIKFYPSKNSNLFQTVVEFNYLEILKSGDTVRKSLSFFDNTSYKSNVDSWTPMERTFSNATFYSSLVAQISPDDNVVKRLVNMPNSININVMSADENLYTYMQVTRPASGIAQDKPIFTNLYIDESCDPKYKVAFGVFASRYKISMSKALGMQTLDSISNGIYTKQLKFANRYDNYYILNKPYDN